ncbi:MAG: helix-hairpin-helix domain-containing protein [Halorientalis sp.]
MSRNAEVAALLEEFADRLEARDVEYKPRAYRRAAENVRAADAAVEGLAEEGPDAVAEIDRVGDAIAAKIVEYLETGEIAELEDLREEMPADIEALTRVEGVGPKTVGTLYAELGIETLDDLEAAAREGEIREVSGFGPKTEQNILDNIDFAREAHERELLGEARPYGDRVRDFVAGLDGVAEAALAGSLRRWRPTIGDVDVLAATEDPEPVVAAFTDWEEADEVVEAGETKASVRTDGFGIDLRLVVPEEFGSALQYFTGSKAHNVTLRNRAIDRDLKVNEYGVFRQARSASGSRTQSDDDVSDADEEGQRAGERVAGETEESMYAALDLPWIPPELREDRGEVAAAAAGELPDLVETGDVRGDLHTHTEWSDGNHSIAEMAEGAAAFGHEYLAVTDHATGPGMVGGVGLDDEALREQLAAVREADDDADVTLLAGVEANVTADGDVSVGDDVLADLDLVVASPHAGLDGDGTDRLVSAVEHPHVDVLGHPTGRLLNQRSGLDVSVERLAAAAADAGVALEVNSDPRRLDLDGGAVKTAIEAGATVVVNTDAHRPGTFENVRYGVHTARRGWAEAGDVLNARDADGVRSFLGL